ncbi:hypothetical protein HDU97_003206 [Phlyctochytrium planicorne]|nr:hypothetical protein HDU97_003206 [Phlyctochytrium planicorne]
MEVYMTLISRTIPLIPLQDTSIGLLNARSKPICVPPQGAKCCYDDTGYPTGYCNGDCAPGGHSCVTKSDIALFVGLGIGITVLIAGIIAFCFWKRKQRIRRANAAMGISPVNANMAVPNNDPSKTYIQPGYAGQQTQFQPQQQQYANVQQNQYAQQNQYTAVQQPQYAPVQQTQYGQAPQTQQTYQQPQYVQP